MAGDKEQRVLEFVERFSGEKGYPPTVRDIQRGCGLSSTSVVEYHLRALERKGHIRREREVSRGILPARPRTVRVPLLGAIAAGQPIPVPTPDAWQTAPLETLDVPQEMVAGSEEAFALRVKGTSMVDALVNDGDIVILRPQANAQNGDMVAVWLKSRGEVTLKKLYRQGKKVRLQPANAQMSPIVVDQEDVEVQGKVLGVLRFA